tara:strand:+ start:304 stop:690 length:387 start_codon:yes stop_codon:yes gene_type:complete
MEFIPSVKDAFNKFGTFSGRSSRSQYWWFFLFGLLSGFFFNIIDYIFLGVNAFSNDPNEPTGWFNLLWSLFLLTPSLAVGSRRLHDINKSGWWQLLWIVLLVGWIPLIIWFCKKSDDEVNDFGELTIN